MRYLVTGAAGFIGSHLCRRLVADGHEVVALDDLSDGSLSNLSDVPEVAFEEADLRDGLAVRRLTEGCDVVLHHGAMKSVPRSVRLPEATTEVNVRGTLNVLVAAREVGAAVVFASSSSVYGDQDAFPLREELDPRPRSPYAATKLAGEALCRAWWHSYGVPTIVFRYFNVYGPWQDPSSEYAAVIPRFAVLALEGRPATIHGDGEQARDFTYVDDVVDANLRASRMPDAARGRVMNVGGGAVPTPINELHAMIGALAGSDVEAEGLPAREGDIRRSEADISLARELIGYSPRVDVTEGVRRTVEWFAARIVRSP